MHILIKGFNFCEQYSEVPEILQAEINMNETWMQVAEGSVCIYNECKYYI